MLSVVKHLRISLKIHTRIIRYADDGKR